jgi:hypothetical protein
VVDDKTGTILVSEVPAPLAGVGKCPSEKTWDEWRGAGRVEGWWRGATLRAVDATVVVPLLLGVLFVFAALIHQWWVTALPLTLIPLFYAGLAKGWWGAGVGDGWQFVAAAATVLALLAATLGVEAGRVLSRLVRRE